METQSLDYLIETEDFLGKFATALENDDGAVRKHTFEILAALCVYSKEGYARALGVLEHYKITKKKKYRFSLIVDELRATDNVHYKIILLEFINCLIIYTDISETRIRIRNEFYSLKLQEILNSLKSEEEQHIVLQLQVFEDHKANDEEQFPGVKGLDLNSALDIFNAIFKQVSDTPLELHFLTCLQHLLKIDNTEALADKIWQTVDQLISKCALIESPEEAQKLLVTSTRKLDKQGDGRCCCSCHKGGGDRGNIGPKVRSDSLSSSPTSHDDVSVPKAAAPPPPPPCAEIPPPPPPPPPPMVGGPPPPPPPPPGGLVSPATINNKQALPQQNTPKPKTKMRSLQWQKIPVVKVIGKTNLWTMVGKTCSGYKVNYHKMDDLFSVNQNPQTDSGTPGTERKKKENTEVTLIESRRSLNVNIFMKQFRMSNEEIVRLLGEGDSGKFGAEKLRGLQKLLPTHDEVEIIKSFDGDKERLGDAEKFFVCLMTLPNYNLRIEGLLIKEDFNDNMEWIRPSIESIIQAAKDIKDNKFLRELIYLVLIAGNYLNSGNYAGNAVGFKLSSLVKLTEIRANKPRMNLMHYVVMEAEENNPQLLTFPEEMKALRDASQISIESVTSDILCLANKVSAITGHINQMNDTFRSQMEPFLKEANYEMLELKEDIKDIDHLRTELADFFCEDPNNFKLEECFKTLTIFCDRFKKAIGENIDRKIQEEKAEARRKQKESEHSKRTRDVKEPSEQSIERHVNDDGSIVDMLLADVRSGFASRPLGDNSFSVTKVKKVNLDSLNVAGSLQTGVGEISFKSDTSELAIDPNDFVRLGFGRVSMRRRRLHNLRQPDSPTPTDSTDTESTCSSLEEANVSEISNTKRSRKSYATSDDESLIEFLVQSGEKPDKTPFDKNGSMRRRRKERLERRGLQDIFGSERERASSPALSDNICDKSQNVTESPLAVIARPKHDLIDEKSESPLRRSRSMVDRSAVNRALAQAKEITQTKKSVDDSDHEQFLSRMKRKLYNKIEDTTSSPVPLEADRGYNKLNNSVESPTEIRSRNRWRNGITSCVIPDSSRTLETISEKDKFSQTEDDNNNIKIASALHRSKEQFSNRFRNTLDSAELSKMIQEVETKSVNVSISEQLNRTYNLQEDMKKVETGEKLLECEISNPSQPNSRPETPSDISEECLKKKRERRKMRSQLSIEEVHAALKHDNKPETILPSKQMQKSPVVPPRRSLSDDQPDNLSVPVSPSEDKHIVSKAARLAGKKKFRHDRFGDKNNSDNSVDRCKSNVEGELVDKAIKDLVSQGNMSRSKSYDEAVAKQAICDNEPSLRNRGSTCTEKRRGSTSRLSSSDDRRYGIVFQNEDSDCDMKSNSNEKLHDSYNGDSPKSQSRLSLKSTNTSTETLQAYHSDGDKSPQLRRQSSSSAKDIDNNQFQSSVRGNPGVGKFSKSNDFNSDINIIDDDPQRSLSQWKQRRSIRGSTGDYGDHDVKLNKYKHNTFMRNDYNNLLSTRTDSSDMRNEVGSRSSYASSQDEGFESMSGTSGTGSQRASMVSTLDSYEYCPAQCNRNTNHQPLPTEIVEEDKKQRTESWTASTLNATAGHNTSIDSSIDYNVISTVNNHDIPKEEIWSENLNDTVRLKSTQSDKPKSPTPNTTLQSTKSAKSPPSYMRGTHASTTKTPSVTGNKSGPRTVRASMRVAQALRKSADPTTNLSKSKTVTGSNSSLTASNSSDLSTSTTQSKASTAHRLFTTTSANRPNTSSPMPTTSSTRSTTPSRRVTPSSRPVTPSARLSSATTAKSSLPSSTSSPKPFTRTQSMRVSSTTRKSIVSPSDVIRSKTPSTEVSETPRRRGFMEPTASYRASRKELPQIPSPESTIKARVSPASSGFKPAGNITPSPLTRHGSMRRSNKSPALSTPIIEDVTSDKGRITPTKRIVTKDPSKQLSTVTESRSSFRRSEVIKSTTPINDNKRKIVK